MRRYILQVWATFQQFWRPALPVLEVVDTLAGFVIVGFLVVYGGVKRLSVARHPLLQLQPLLRRRLQQDTP